jgi:hypothetical protein
MTLAMELGTFNNVAGVSTQSYEGKQPNCAGPYGRARTAKPND